jgi:hypothetical protein
MSITYSDPAAQRQLNQQRQALAIKASFPGRLCELVCGVVVHHYLLTPKKLAARCETHNAAVQELKQRAKAGIAELEAAFAIADDPESYEKLFDSIAAARVDKAALAREAVELSLASRALAIEVRDDLEPHVAHLREEASSTLIDTKMLAEELGFGPKAHPGYASHPRAIEQQFENYCRTMNVKVRKAFRDADQARTEHEGAVQQVTARQEALAAAKKLVHEIAISQVTS